MDKESLKKLEEVLIQVGLRIARRGEGALFVVGEASYQTLVKQSVKSFFVIDNQKLLESLALIDVAVIISEDGKMKAYGAMINSTKTLRGFGTRHSAAISASQNAELVIIVSEEDRKVKILKNGRMIMQLDALQKNVEEGISYAVNILESVGAGTIGAIGTSLIVPGLGIALVPGVIVFGSAYYLTKIISKKLGR